MDWLNYHHLQYFWTVAREGSVTAASVRLHVSQPTISTQLRKLETNIGQPLFERVGRGLVLTDVGRVVYRYADEIFSLGRELADTLRGRPAGSPLRVQVGVSDALPKLVAYRLLQPAFELAEPVAIACYEGKPADLLTRLAVHELDVVLADSPAPSQVGVRAFSHRLGECPTAVFAPERDGAKYADGFPQSLDDAPLLVPTADSQLRRALEHWLDRQDLRPRIVGEFEDTALMKVFGQAGVGLFVGPSIIEAEVQRQYGVRRVGLIDAVREQFYAISMERKMKHPAVIAITDTARAHVFDGTA
jgi:LysR family transcriptional activator of nhaA